MLIPWAETGTDRQKAVREHRRALSFQLAIYSNTSSHSERVFELVFTPNLHPSLPWLYQTISVTLVVIQSLSTYTAAALELRRKQTGGLSPLSSVLSTLATRGQIMSKLPPIGPNNVLSNRSRHIARLPCTAPLRQTNEDTAHPPTASAIRLIRLL